MATQLQPSDWIDRYVAEVGSMLPARQRADVQAEIRTLIEDELEARPVADEAAVLDVLRNFGRPSQVAMRYGATQYLIGPALYPLFVKVLRVVLAVTLALGFFVVAVGAGLGNGGLGVAAAIASILTGLFQAGATVVLVFAIIDRLNRSSIERTQRVWDPHTLSVVRDEDRVRTGEMVVNIAFTIVALLVFNFYLESIGRYFVAGEGWHIMPVFAPQFAAYVPWLSTWWIAELVLSIAVLARGHWQLRTCIVQIGINLFGLAVLFQMLVGESLAAWPLLEPAFSLVIGIIFAATAFDTLKIVYGILTRGSRLPATAPHAPVPS